MKTVYVPVQIEGLAVMYVPDDTDLDTEEIKNLVEYSIPMLCGNKMVDVTITVTEPVKVNGKD